MNLRTLMQAGPAKANELFGRLAETSAGAVKTRERLYGELKTELELHTRLEEQHLFPILRRHDEKELVADAIRDNRELQAKLKELDALPKTDEGFLEKIQDLRKAFRQHARDDKTEILPAVQRALSEEQVQTVTEKMEAGRAEAEQARQDEAEERRLKARQEREQADQAEAAEQARVEAERHVQETARQMTDAVLKPVEIAADSAFEAARVMADAAKDQAPAARAPASSFAELFLWPWSSTMQGLQQGRGAPAGRPAASAQEVIPLGEEYLDISKRTVERGTARVRRFVVETPVEEQVTLQSERVVIERRKPVGETSTGEVLTEVTVEVTETTEVPVVAKRVRLREEIVVRTERSEHVETVQETLRHDDVEIHQPSRRRVQQLRRAAPEA